jgi:hypothetical protein
MVLSEFVYFSDLEKTIKFVQEILQKSNHKQQETRKEGEKHDSE